MEPIRFGIVTLLSDSGMVRTTCPGVGKHRLVDNRLRIEIPKAEPAELFARHQEHVDGFCQARGSKLRRLFGVPSSNLSDSPASIGKDRPSQIGSG